MACNCCFHLVRHIKESRPSQKLSGGVEPNQEQHILKSPMNDIILPKVRFLDRLWRDFSNFNNHVAIECVISKKSYTYQQLRKSMAVFATSLRKKLGLRPGDVVGAMLPNCPQFPVVALGAIQAGCIISFPVNPLSNEAEVAYQVSITEPKVFVTIPQFYDTVLKGLDITKRNIKIIIVDNPQETVPDNTIRYSKMSELGEADYALLDKIVKKTDDVAVIPFSSGTTNQPKGVEITHGNLTAAIEILHNERTCTAFLTQGDLQEIVPCILPFTHIYGFMAVLLAHLAKGCKLLSVPKFSPALYLDVLKNYKPTILYVVPPVASLLAKHPEVNEELLRSVRHVICGAALLNASDADAIMKKTNNKVQFNQGYGATETCAVTSLNLISAKVTEYSACGVPMANVRIKFLDPLTGDTVPIGEPGEICVKSPAIMKGYHKNPEATAKIFTIDGYLKTGDLGYYKPDAGLFIIGRINELIKVKGKQVVPTEIENVLNAHPAVQDAAVVGIPHGANGESIKAFVVKRNGQEVSADELCRFVADQVEDYKQIDELIFVMGIPRTNSGKILRRHLKAMSSPSFYSSLK